MRRLFLFFALVCGACAARWTDADEGGDKAAEQMLSRLYALDAGATVRVYSRAGLCAVQGTLARHDAGRLVGPVDCVQERK